MYIPVYAQNLCPTPQQHSGKAPAKVHACSADCEESFAKGQDRLLVCIARVLVSRQR